MATEMSLRMGSKHAARLIRRGSRADTRREGETQFALRIAKKGRKTTLFFAWKRWRDGKFS
jgi:hypothetical protein